MIGRLFDIAVAMAAFGVLLVLPGFGLQWVLARFRGRSAERDAAATPRDDATPRERDAAATRDTALSNPAAGRDAPAPSDAATSLVLAIAWSVILVSAAGAVLLAFAIFSAEAVAVFALVAAAVGVLPFLRFGLRLPRHALAAVPLGALALPWVWLATRDGFRPASSFQWYYWNLGTQLDQAGGIPTFVAEFGDRVRWLPDYVLFNILSEGYGALAVGMSESAALSYWRVPAALFGVLMVYLVQRLWLGRAAAIGGAAVTSATTFYILKFNAYKAEPMAIALGLVAVWLVVQGVRGRRASWILLAGSVAGVAVGVHAIGATVTAMLLLTAGTVEWLTVRRPWRLSLAVVLLCGGIAAGAVVVATGVSLQGRAVVASDAAHPAVVDGIDPTYTFFRRTAGGFEDAAPRGRGTRVRAAIDRPWPGIDVLEGRRGKAVLGVVALGLVLALLVGGAGLRKGVVSIGAFGGLLAAGMAFFAVSFDTYVPQHTGIARFGSYLPLVIGLAVGPSIEGFLLGLRRVRVRPGPRLAAVLVAVVAVPWAIMTVMAPLRSEQRVNGGKVGPEFGETDERLGRPAEQAVAALLKEAAPDDAVLSNASTRGTIEFLTGREAPLEGRQPFIEDSSFLLEVNDLLLDTHEYFLDPSKADVLQRLDVRWLLVAGDPSALGANFSYSSEDTPIEEALGRSLVVERLARQPYLETVWRGGGVGLFRTREPSEPVDQVGEADPRPVELILSGVALALVLVGVGAVSRRAVKRTERRADATAPGA